MRIIHQLVHTLSYGDAISSEVLALQAVFQELGFESEVYALNVHPNHKGKARNIDQLEAGFEGEVLLHYSLGSPLNDLYRQLEKARRGIIYHNLTPAHWFEGVNSRIARDIESGQKELPQLLALSDMIIADSPFNAGEIERLGYAAEVLPLTVDPGRWNMPSNSGIASLVQSEPGLHLLHVGRLAPNKCIEDIIRVFYFLHHGIIKKSKLWLVGIDIDTELYSFGLKRLAYQLRLNEAVQFVGCMADSEVRALYEHCSAYLCMSEHEGFCLPVVESMYFGLPVVAYDSSALADTVGSGGILVREKRHAEIAELLAEIHTNTSLRSELVTAGKQRVQELSYERFRQNVVAMFSVDKRERSSRERRVLPG